ncbi:hypothetical protein [Aneurinibacillus terranovensis]|uniref:hypothetical protein n=1 Tax=Aneurinibacillus terranovensis TaxID=278991 RepID=UPI00055201F8|nr:hypothetical protein [Aneurinibacillus terranovensis]
MKKDYKNQIDKIRLESEKNKPTTDAFRAFFPSKDFDPDREIRVEIATKCIHYLPLNRIIEVCGLDWIQIKTIVNDYDFRAFSEREEHITTENSNEFANIYEDTKKLLDKFPIREVSERSSLNMRVFKELLNKYIDNRV